MRTSLVVLLLACGGGFIADAGPEDAGVIDAGSRDAGALRVTMRYMYSLPQGLCDATVRECSVTTSDDGGLRKWRNIYEQDAGCAFIERPANVDGGPEAIIDCLAKCQPDAGNLHAYGCCVPGGRPLWCDATACGWTPP